MRKPAVIVGKHYWLTFDRCRVPLLIKVFNIQKSGLIGGLLYHTLTGEVSFSKGFHPQGSAWNEFNAIPEEAGQTEVRKENIHGIIETDEIGNLKHIANQLVDDFFDSDVSQPLYKKM